MKKLFLLVAICGLVAFVSCSKKKDCTCTSSTLLNGEVVEGSSINADFLGADVKKCSDLGNADITIEVPNLEGGKDVQITRYECKNK